MAAEHPPVQMHDVARLGGFRPQPLHHRRIFPVRHEADVLAVRLGRHLQPQPLGNRPRLVLRQAAKGKAQELKLLRRGGEHEVALVAAVIHRPVQLRPARALEALHVMPGRQRVGPQVARGCQQVAELHPLIAAHAGNGRLAARIGVGKIEHHRVLEPAFVIQHVMGNVQLLGHAPGIVNVLARAAGALALHGSPVVIELQRNAHHVIARLRVQRGGDGAVHPAGHGDNNPRIGGLLAGSDRRQGEIRGDIWQRWHHGAGL